MLQISLGDLHIDGWLARGLVFGFDDLTGFVFVGRMEAVAFASLGVNAIETSSAGAPTN